MEIEARAASATAPHGIAVVGVAALPATLAAGAERVRLAPGEPVTAGAADCFLVLDGVLELASDELFPPPAVRPGELLRGTPVGVVARAARDARLARLRPASAAHLLALPVQEAAALGSRVYERVQQLELLTWLTPLFGELDEAQAAGVEASGEWVRLARGELLVREGDPGDSLFVLLGGRLQAVLERPDGTRRILGEIGPGESIGEMALLSGEPRGATVVAVRDSVLLRFPEAEFERLAAGFPRLVRSIARVQIERLGRANRSADPKRTVTNLAVVPAAPDVPLDEFCRRLAAALASEGPVLHLTREVVEGDLGPEAFAAGDGQSLADIRLPSWLAEQEEAHRFVVYQADPLATAWSALAVRQADRVLVVGRGSGDPSPTAAEQALLPRPGTAAACARRILVLLHAPDVEVPAGTRRWLEERSIDEHFHLRWADGAGMARLVRSLAGRSFGLVLGGGGARGFAHIGIIRALLEAGVPIDMVGGTSMGAAMAAQHAMGWSPERMLQVNRHVWVELKPHKKFTLPLLSIVSTRGSDYCGEMMYGDVRIEDLWVPFFCVSSSLTRGGMVVHRSGSLLRAVTASSSLPGVAVPVLHEGDLLVDGGLLNNVPGDVMRDLGCGRVMAANVSVEEESSFVCERIPSVREVFWSRFGRRKLEVGFPSIAEIVLRSAMLSSIGRERVVMRDADVVFRPPIERFSLMGFDDIDEIAEAGYVHATAFIQEKREAGLLPAT
jgi:predicted acylesterase/phospholipase RssA